jgi:hypothetical protein
MLIIGAAWARAMLLTLADSFCYRDGTSCALYLLEDCHRAANHPGF